MKLNISKTIIFFGLIFLVVIATRFLWLDRFPPGMQHDEIEYTLSSKTYQMFGKDLSGVSFPASLISTKTHGSISPIPPILLSTVWNILPLNLLTVHLAYTLLNMATAVVLGLLVKTLFKNSYLGLIASLLFLINPWSFFLSRQALESAFALFFFTLGIYFMLRQSRNFLILSFLSLLLGFFSYHGAKLIYLPVVFSSLVYLHFSQKKSSKFTLPLITYALLATMVFAGFMIFSKILPGSTFSTRSSEIIFFNQEYLSSQVDNTRKIAITTPINSLFINKATSAFQFFTQQYFVALSPKTLFATGEVYRTHGYFFLFEIILLVFGSIQLFVNNRRVFYYLTSLFLFAPIITAMSMNGESILNRSFLLLPLIIIVTSYGLFESFALLKKYIPKQLVAIGFVGMYAIFYSQLLFTYFFQLPIHEHGFYQVATRVLARYVQMENSRGTDIVVVSKEPRQIYLETLFFSPPMIQKQLLLEKQTFEDRKDYRIGNIQFVTGCPNVLNPTSTYIIPTDFTECFPKVKNNYLILDQIDAGVIYRIVRGNACSGANLSRWRGEHLISDYAIESMDDQKFCERWIAQEIQIAQ